MKKIIITLIVVLTSSGAFAQVDLGTFLEGGEQDANKLLENYLEPVFVGFGYAMNSGWYNTGKPHKLLGFDITVSGSFANVPTSAEFFDLNPADYDNLTTGSGGVEQAPTIMGPNLNPDDMPEMVFNQGTADELRITTPTGIGLDEEINLNAVPAPMAQIGIGLIKNTEIKLRLLPEQSFGDPGEEVTTSMFGIGVLHDVKQWIPGISNLPFDLSAFVGFNRLSSSFNIDADNPDQVADFEVSGTTLQAIISKKLAVLTVYGGLGFLTSNTSFSLDGTYDIADGTTFTDPVNFDYSTGGLRANIGARLKLLILTIHAEYALQEYNTVTAGVGISIR